MISFEIVRSGDADAVQIYVDDEGLRTLIQKLERVRQVGHLHLRSQVDLAERSPYGGCALPEVIITKSDFDC